MAEGFDVEAKGEAFLRSVQVDHGWPDDAVEHGEGMMERFGVAGEAAQQLLLKMKGSEEGAVSGQEIDVAGESCGGFIGFDADVDVEGFEFVGIEGPCVGFCGEDRRSCCIEGSESMHQGRITLGFGEMVEVVGVLTQVDKFSTCVGGIRPGHDQHGIVSGTFGGPFGEHSSLS